MRLSINDPVILVDAKLIGRVTAICFREHGVSYEVTWWVDSAVNVAFFAESEVFPHQEGVECPRLSDCYEIKGRSSGFLPRLEARS